jgi:hypothetical protein
MRYTAYGKPDSYYVYVTCELCKARTATWARRLRSSWGPHWKCEEDAKNLGCGPSLALAMACKRLSGHYLELERIY